MEIILEIILELVVVCFDLLFWQLSSEPSVAEGKEIFLYSIQSTSEIAFIKSLPLLTPFPQSALNSLERNMGRVALISDTKLDRITLPSPSTKMALIVLDLNGHIKSWEAGIVLYQEFKVETVERIKKKQLLSLT